MRETDAFYEERKRKKQHEERLEQSEAYMKGKSITQGFLEWRSE